MTADEADKERKRLRKREYNRRFRDKHPEYFRDRQRARRTAARGGKEPRPNPLVTARRESESRWFRAAVERPELMDKVGSMMSVVIGAAKRCRGQGIDIEDLVQEAFIDALGAVVDYGEQSAGQLATYVFAKAYGRCRNLTARERRVRSRLTYCSPETMARFAA